MMRAKMQVTRVEHHVNSPNETVHFTAVAKSTAYPPDGADDDNTYARWSPSGGLHLQIANPALHGKFNVGDKFYLDFTPA